MKRTALSRSTRLPKFRAKPRRKSKPAPVKVAVVRFDDGREICQQNAAGRHEYYSRIAEMMLRQGMVCPLCEDWLSSEDVQFEHQAGRGFSGAHRDDRIVVNGHWQNAAVCGKCNTAKGSRRYEWRSGEYVPKERAA